MAFSNITVVNPLPDGTPIFDVSDGVDKKRPVGLSNNWSVRWRVAKKGGCPSWIDQIVIADDPSVLKKTTVRAVQVPAIASSSKSSRDVIAIFLDADGDEATRTVVSFVYVAKSHDSGIPDRITGKNIPIADELWFSSRPVNDKVVTDAEAECNHSLL